MKHASLHLCNHVIDKLELCASHRSLSVPVEYDEEDDDHSDRESSHSSANPQSHRRLFAFQHCCTHHPQHCCTHHITHSIAAHITHNGKLCTSFPHRRRNDATPILKVSLHQSCHRSCTSIPSLLLTRFLTQLLIKMEPLKILVKKLVANSEKSKKH